LVSAAAPSFDGRTATASNRTDGPASSLWFASTHVMSLEDGPKGYQMFKDKEDGCVRSVFRPNA
jgi:threonine dehydrogenase-like Zn-dependent dehydrogenase